ncbi:MAG: immunoglobulin domain-containing protein, partial [Bacteroidales bacterium]
PPTVYTYGASSLSGASVRLNGGVNPNNSLTSVYFEYGLDATYGSTVDGDPLSINGNYEQSIFANLTGLDMSTTYHYRIVATNSADTTFGDDMTFATLNTMYCTPTYYTGCDIYNMGLTYFELNAISQSISCEGIPSYYHNFPASTDITKGATYTISVRSGYYYGYTYVRFWIDYNQNNTFDGVSEEVAEVYCNDSYSTFTIPFTVSASALTGASTLRAMTNYYGHPIDPCGYYDYGNCSDFQVNILPSIQPPTVTTAITTVSDECTAVSGGDVTDVGGSPVTERGVCWGLLVNPVSTDFHTTDGTGIGSFVSDITGLIAGATYHVRAYATNTFGTTYGDDLTISTPAPEITGIPAVCAGTTTTLACTQTGGTWASESIGIASIGDPSVGIVTGVSEGQAVITYTYVNTNGCTCSVAVTVAVSIPPASPNPVTATPSTIFVGGVSNLNATSASNNILWYTSPTEGTSIGSSASGVNFAVSPDTTTTYYAEAIVNSGSSTQVFDYTGNYQTFTVPAGVYSLTIDAFGAEGIGLNGFLPGQGGRAQGELAVVPGQVLYIYVGGRNLFNGGGSGRGGANGGDASDVRLGGMAISDRIIVAGGGGGAGGDSWHCLTGNGDGGGGTAGANYVG